METETQDLEIVEKESQVVSIPSGSLDEKLANVEKAFELITKLRKFALTHLSANCVVNQEGNPYIMENGVNPFTGPFGIYEKNITGSVVKDNGTQMSLEDTDAFRGELKAIIYKGIVGSKVTGVELSFEGGVYMSETEEKFHNKEDFLWFCKKAKANWRGRAIRKLLGLDNVSWEELAQVGIKQSDCTSVTRKKGSAAPLTPEQITEENRLRCEIQKMLSEFIVDAHSRSNQLEELTQFTGRDGNVVKGVRDPKYLSGKRLQTTYGKARKWHEKMTADWGGSQSNEK